MAAGSAPPVLNESLHDELGPMEDRSVSFVGFIVGSTVADALEQSLNLVSNLGILWPSRSAH